MSQYQNSRGGSVAYTLHTKLTFKLIIVGDQGTGKTSLIMRYVKGIFQKTYKITVGVEFYSKVQNIYGEDQALQIWDTAGQQNFKSIARSFYKMASCVLITYSNPKNMIETINQWINQINEFAHDSIQIVLVRTKTDEIPINENELSIINDLKNKYPIKIFQHVSSKLNQNITQLFQQIGQHLADCYSKDQAFKELVDPKKQSFIIDTSVKKKKQKVCC